MKTALLGEVAQINPRATKLPDDQAVSFVGMAQLDAASALALALDTRPFAEVAKGYTQFMDGDILVAKITPCWENGKVGIAQLEHPYGAGSTEFHVVRPRDDLDSRYALHFLRQAQVRGAGELRMTGSGGQRRVPADFLGKLEVPLPPLGEQRRIAAILDQADMIRTKRRQVLAHLDALLPALAGQMLEGCPWSGTLADLAYVQIGPFGSLLHKSDYVEGGVPVINPMHIQNGSLAPDGRFTVSERKANDLALYRLKVGDVVMGRRGEMGRAAVVRNEHRDFLCGTGSLILRPRRGIGDLLHAVVTSPRMRSYLERSSLGATLPNLNASIVNSAPAPNLDAGLSCQFAVISEAMRALVERASLSLVATEQLFASLQARAFKGEL